MTAFPPPSELQAPETFDSIQESCWRLLDAAVINTDSSWRLPVLGTKSKDGVELRTVVLRKVDAERRSLLIHTDARSPKVAQIENYPAVSLLFYDQSLNVQLQLRGIASIHRLDAVAEELWKNSPPSSLRMYLGPLAPGTICAGPAFNLPTALVGRIPEQEELAPGYHNFAVVQILVQEMEWLRLSRDGNLRCRFLYQDGTVQNAEWMAP